MTTLTVSYCPADTSDDLLDQTVGDALRAAAAEAPDRVAIVEGAPGSRRERTYARLLDEAEQVARALLAPVPAGRPRRGLVGQRPGVGGAGVRRRPRLITASGKIRKNVLRDRWAGEAR